MRDGTEAQSRWPSHAEYLATPYFPSLDALRALSIIPVIWHHATPRPLEGVLGRGPLGVDLFFSISGFLITTLLLREQKRTGTISLRLFYGRRALRIFPLYYLVLSLHILYVAVLPAAAPERSHFFRSLPFYAAYCSNWFVDWGVNHPVVFAFSWSLATEEQFYLVWPWIVRSSRRAVVPALFMIGLLAFDWSVERGWWGSMMTAGGLSHRMATSIATPICLGALLALVLHVPRTFGWAARVLGMPVSAPTALGLLFLLVSWDAAPLLAIHVAMTALVGAFCIRSDHGLVWVAKCRSLSHVGAVSYGMYLLHVAVIGMVKRLLPSTHRPAWLVFAIALPVSLGVATLSFRHFEQPFLRLKDRLRRPNA